MDSSRIPRDEFISFPLISPTTETAIPAEIFDRILSYLQPHDLITASAVSHTWHRHSIDVEKQAEDALARSFINTVVEKLDDEKYSEQKARLLSLTSDRTVLGSVNLMDIVDSMYTLRNKIINILKEIDFEDLKMMDSLLANERNPLTFNFVFRLAMFEQGLNYASHLTSDDHFGLYAIWANIIEWVGFDFIDVVVKRIPEEVKEYVVSMVIIPKLVEYNQVEKAAELTSQITDETSRNYCLSLVSNAYLSENKIEEAMGYIGQMTYDHQELKEREIRGVFSIYCENGEIEKASKLISNLPEGEEKETDLIILDITKALIEGDKDLAKELAQTLPSESYIDQVLSLIESGSWFFSLPTKH